jgi:hypothetical protein
VLREPWPHIHLVPQTAVIDQNILPGPEHLSMSDIDRRSLASQNEFGNFSL